MAATNIVLADALATPVNHTFVPIGPDRDGVFWFEDQSQANSVGYWRISVQLKRPKPGVAGQSANRTNRVIIAMHQPVLETVSNSTVSGIAPAPTIAYIPRSFHEFVEPDRCSPQNRKDLRKMSANLLADAQIIAVIENLTGIY